MFLFLNKLKTILKKDISTGQIGESWEISDVDGNQTLVANGEWQGKTLKENDIFILEPYEIADPQFFLTRGFLQISIVSKISKHHFFYRIV